MKRKISIIVILFFCGIIFIMAGMPLLKYIKNSDFGKYDNNSTINNTNNDSNIIRLDLFLEDMCIDIMTGDVDLECSSPNTCRSTCLNKGCPLFALNYQSFEFIDNKCYCLCIEKDII